MSVSSRALQALPGFLWSAAAFLRSWRRAALCLHDGQRLRYADANLADAAGSACRHQAETALAAQIARARWSRGRACDRHRQRDCSGKRPCPQRRAAGVAWRKAVAGILPAGNRRAAIGRDQPCVLDAAGRQAREGARGRVARAGSEISRSRAISPRSTTATAPSWSMSGTSSTSSGVRVHRISGQERGGGSTGDPWVGHRARRICPAWPTPP